VDALIAVLIGLPLLARIRAELDFLRGGVR
jgi:hypothetical protein